MARTYSFLLIVDCIFRVACLCRESLRDYNLVSFRTWCAIYEVQSFRPIGRSVDWIPLRSNSKTTKLSTNLKVFVFFCVLFISLWKFLVWTGCTHFACVEVQTHVDVVYDIFTLIYDSFQGLNFSASTTFIPI